MFSARATLVSMGFGDDGLQYRTPGIAPRSAFTDPTTSEDAANYDTLKSVYKDLKAAMENIDKWHAFDLAETGGIAIKQQILAHQVAYDMVLPAFEAVQTALETVDREFIQSQQRS